MGLKKENVKVNAVWLEASGARDVTRVAGVAVWVITTWGNAEHVIVLYMNEQAAEAAAVAAAYSRWVGPLERCNVNQ